MRQVIDASVVLAYILGEPGGDILTGDQGPFVLSTVNLAEVLTKVTDRGLDTVDVSRVLRRLLVELVDYGRDDAVRTAALRPATVPLGLSLGDRVCLALAQRLGLPVLTADRAWSGLDVGVAIHLMR